MCTSCKHHIWGSWAVTLDLQNKEKEEAKANKDTKSAADSAPQAADATPSTAPGSPTPKPDPAQALRTATAQRAQRFQKQYFTGGSSSSGAQTDGMRQLSSICSQLATPGKVQELLSLLQDQETANISTFEFLTSGAVHQLREFLAGNDLMKGKTKVHVDSQKLLQRLHAFWEAAMAQGKDGTPPMQSLVSCTSLQMNSSLMLYQCSDHCCSNEQVVHTLPVSTV